MIVVNSLSVGDNMLRHMALAIPCCTGSILDSTYTAFYLRYMLLLAKGAEFDFDELKSVS